MGDGLVGNSNDETGQEEGNHLDVPIRSEGADSVPTYPAYRPAACRSYSLRAFGGQAGLAPQSCLEQEQRTGRGKVRRTLASPRPSRPGLSCPRPRRLSPAVAAPRPASSVQAIEITLQAGPEGRARTTSADPFLAASRIVAPLAFGVEDRVRIIGSGSTPARERRGDTVGTKTLHRMKRSGRGHRRSNSGESVGEAMNTDRRES